MFRRGFWVSLILTIPVLLFCSMIQEWFGFSLPEFTGSNLFAAVTETSLGFSGKWRR